LERRSRDTRIIMKGIALLVSLATLASACCAFVVAPCARSSANPKHHQLTIMMVPTPFVDLPTSHSPTVVEAKTLQASEWYSLPSSLSDRELHQRLSATSAPTVDRVPALATTSNVLALQERHVPTAEEVAAKKLTFNLWLWGGGFLAPFIATVFYFGPKFWTK
jgi:hypothetical protein